MWEIKGLETEGKETVWTYHSQLDSHRNFRRQLPRGTLVTVPAGSVLSAH